MSYRIQRTALIVVAIVSTMSMTKVFADEDPLESWNDVASKQAIVEFVTRVTKQGSADFLPTDQRIAVFDHDGTLWSEQPMYVQGAFTFDRVKSLAEQHPEWRQKQPFQGVLEENLAAVALAGEKGIVEIVTATHAGMTTDEFSKIVSNWLAKARHPQWKRPYVECVYLPMLELLTYLRANGFQTYIVSGGGAEFIRVFAEKTYGVTPQRVIGSTLKTRLEIHDGTPTIMRLPELNFLCDGSGKPVEIHRVIGSRPVMAFGNSDGDVEMLEYATTGAGPRFAGIIHHTDSERETAYDKFSIVGRLDRGLKQAAQRNWTIVNMKTDWKQIFPLNVSP